MTPLHPPRIILFDWHGTLVDTSFAMYRAMDDMLSNIDALGLTARLTDSARSETKDDRELVEYVRIHQRLHPRVVSDRKRSRTDLLEILFGTDEQAKDIANRAYNGCYRHHYGEVKAFEPGIGAGLAELRALGIRLGILTNRAREFLDREIETVENGFWGEFFDTTVSGDDTAYLKPSPAPVLRALQAFGASPGSDVWYVGDSASDTISAKTAGISSVFFNGARADADWIATIFPASSVHPYRPDSIVNDHKEMVALVMHTIARDRRAHAYRDRR